MQTQKESVKKRILRAAQEEFLVSGYSNSSMRNIAAQSKITVGNIYSYFSGKEDLFEYLLSDTLQELQNLLHIEVDSNGALTPQSITEMAHQIANIFFRNRIQFLILMDGSAGSRYANIKSTLIQQAAGRIMQEAKIRKVSNADFDSVLAQSLAVAIIEGLIELFRKAGKNKNLFERSLRNFLIIILGDLYGEFRHPPSNP
jgi:AcrR family transcriptional regulator